VKQEVASKPVSPDKFVAIVGLPRSGTTLLAALLDAHPRVCLYYEPWNASPKGRPPVLATPDAFAKWMGRRFHIRIGPRERVTGFKETTILPDSTAWATATIDAIARVCPMHVVWIFRDPMLCLLSKIEGARKWWGYPDSAVTRDSVLGYLRETEASLRALESVATRHRGLLVRYESLVADPVATLTDLMSGIGEAFDPAQLEYHLAGPQPHKVMGDPEVASQPAPISAERERRRSAEAEQHRALFELVQAAHPEFALVHAIAERVRALAPVSRFGDAC
jgi:hypothetical protein